ncbi:DUF2238 domain-containing protein [Microbacterium oleivorans]|uniref:DUF2238 domain-containing protein n=1 Tax=Microbacterium oleivorans TaxID=273677 RepID=UPI0010A565C9|nr:DUF2238 domain-containing protein [Microbacterium oleivorans]THE07165.1 DUF2238 domain-containing protein [Microbacterium oleivorans]
MRDDFLRPPTTVTERAADGIRILGLLSVLAAFIWSTATDAGILALALPALLVPRLIGSRPGFDVLFGATVTVAAWSNVLDLYRTIAWWDLVVHFVATGVIAAMALLLLRRFDVVASAGTRRSTVILVPTIGLAISAVWEMIEWLGKTFLAPDIFVTYRDTIGDMSIGGLGALLAGVLTAGIPLSRTALVAANRKEEHGRSEEG